MSTGMSTGPLLLVSWLARAWVALYTRSLPAGIRDRRRAELESDVWEQTFSNDGDRNSPLGRALRVTGRLVRGIPSDLIWRAEQKALADSPTSSRRSVMSRSLVDKGVLGLIVVLALFAVFNGVGIAVDGDMSLVWGISYAGASVAILTGLAVMRRSPLLGGALVVFGALANVILYFWLWPIMLPISGSIVWFGVTRARRLSHLKQAAIAPAGLV